MAGSITISTLNNDTGVFATQNGITGIAKAWVNFDGTASPVSIRSSFNVSSITDNGTGDYTVNFTTAMPNANYFASILGVMANADSSQAANSILGRTTSSLRFGTGFPRSTGGSSTSFDVPEAGVAIFSS
jgi:hypothetical protein